MAINKTIALKPISQAFAGVVLLLLLLISEIANASTQWISVMNLPIPASGVYESVQVASNGPETMLMYTDRINIYYARSTDGGLTFTAFTTVFPYVPSGQRLYGLKIAAATSNAMRGRYMMCFIASGVPNYVEYRDGAWFNQTQLSVPPVQSGLAIAEATGCTASEAKELTWLAITQYLDTNWYHTEMFFAQRTMSDTSALAWTKYIYDQDAPQLVVWANYLNLRETDASCVTCTYKGNCFYMFTTPQTPVPQDTAYKIGRNNFFGNYDSGKTLIDYPNNIGHGLSVVIDDNVTATYVMLFNSNTAVWELKCYYNTLNNMQTSYNYSYPQTLPGYTCPSYTIANQGTLTTEWRFFVKAVNHYQAGAMVVSVNSIRVNKNNTVLYRENVVFTSLDGWKTFTKQYVALDMTYTAKYVTSSLAITDNSFILAISGKDQARVLRRPHTLGGAGITTHSAFSSSPVMSPSTSPTTTRHPTIMPTSMTPSVAPTKTVTSRPTTVGETYSSSHAPSAAPSGGSTGVASDTASGGLSPTVTSVLAAAGATLGIIAIVGVANAIVYVSKYGDDMHKFPQQHQHQSHTSSTNAGSEKNRAATAAANDHQQMTVAPFTV